MQSTTADANGDSDITLLVVEDEDEAREALRELLSRPGREVVVAASVAEALDRLHMPPDLALVDKNLPDGSGLTVIEELKRRRPDAEAIVMTADPTLDSAIDAVRLGACEYIRKPITDLDALEVSLARALSKVRARREHDRRYAKLAESEERYALAVEAASDGLWDWDLDTNYIYLSPRWKETLGYPEEDIGNSLDEWFGRIEREDLPRVMQALASLLEASTEHFEVEYRIRHRDGQLRWVVARGTAVRNEHGRTYRMAGSQSDITRRKEAETQLVHDALHDSLTGLPNRELFGDRLENAFARHQRNRHARFAVLFIDLDRFKNVNDSLGHMAGDDLLRGIASRLQDGLRTCDTLARLGGDEFALLLEGIDGAESVVRVANRIQESLRAPFHVGGQEVFATASIGISIGDRTYDQAEDILRDADTAMYRAKADGRARYAFFRGSMRIRVVEFLRMENDLRRALDRGDISLHYQPIVELSSMRLAGFEALARWRVADGRWVPPSEFIPIAEESGVIVPLGNHILSEALARIRTWEKIMPPGFFVSVNLSPTQFVQPGLADSMYAQICEHGIAPEHLRLELTESALVGDIDAAAETLQEISSRGVHLCLDDFGTGYSSLSHLQRLPFDTLKVDQTFVHQIDSHQTNRDVVRAFVTLGRAMGIEVIAEGIGSSEEVKTLMKMGCNMGQGFLFASPMDADAASAMLRKQNEGNVLFESAGPLSLCG